MLQDKRTLLVLADGRRVRLFEESRRGGPLKERGAWLRAMPPFHHPGSAQQVTVRARTSATSHAGHEPPRDKGERRFLTDLADHLDQVMRDQHFDDLVLIAPPRALGVLRKALPAGLQRRVAATDPHDRLDDTLDQVHAHLRAARLEAEA